MFWDKILKVLLTQMTPALLDVLKQLVREFYKKALETENPIDDVIAYFMMRLLNPEDDTNAL